MTEEEKQTIIRMAKDGFDDKSIAEVVHYNRDHIRRIRTKMGIHRKRGGPGLSQKKIDKIVDLYMQGVTFEEIAERVCVCTKTVTKYTTMWRKENESD